MRRCVSIRTPRLESADERTPLRRELPHARRRSAPPFAKAGASRVRVGRPDPDRVRRAVDHRSPALRAHRGRGPASPRGGARGDARRGAPESSGTNPAGARSHDRSLRFPRDHRLPAVGGHRGAERRARSRASANASSRPRDRCDPGRRDLSADPQRGKGRTPIRHPRGEAGRAPESRMERDLARRGPPAVSVLRTRGADRRTRFPRRRASAARGGFGASGPRRRCPRGCLRAAAG